MQNRENYYSVRKTSAEIVKEAQKSLAASKQFSGIGKVKLVSTKRPITPAVNFEKRQLYSRDVQVPVDRPPSAFNLNYLQNEARALPVLEPLDSGVKMERSESLGNFQAIKFKATLPSLTENRKIHTSHSSDNLCQQQRKERKEKTYKRHVDNLLTPDQLLRSNYLLSQTSTEKLIELLYQYRGFNCDKDVEKNECFLETQNHLCMVLRELYSRITNGKINSTSRSPLLGAIYGLVECNSSKVLLGIAQIVLGLGVGGSNLTGAFKLIFKIAKNEQNDALFIDTDLPELMVDALGKISPLSDGEPEGAIYCYGAIRFLAMSGNYMISQPSAANFKISKHKHLPYRLIKHGIIQLMILHIQIFNEYGSVNEIEGQSLHALYQLLASMRVLLGLPVLGYFVKTRNSTIKAAPCENNDIHLEVAGKHLIKIAFICLKDLYVQANVIRTLSVLSDIEICCDALSSDVVKLGQIIGTFKLEESIDMRSKQKSLGLISRLGYIIGNIMEKNDQARIDFFRNDVVMRYMLELVQFFSSQSYTIQNTNGDSVADVLIKYVRVIANISVNSEVGYFLNLKSHLGTALLNILRNVDEESLKEYKELLIATLAALHNLTYYQNLTDTKQSYQLGSVVDKIRDICETLCYKFLIKEPSLEKIEVIRVLGNMTRDNSVREIFFTSNGLSNIVKCLDDDDKNLLENSCGVLVNILNDSNSRNSFKNLSGMILLRESLKKNIHDKNWFLCETICKAFWNLLIDRSDFVHDFDATEIELLSNDLAEYLDEETIFQGNMPPNEWEQFAQIATDLLEFLQSSSNDNERSLE